MENKEKQYETITHYNTEKNEKRIEYINHPRINSVTHKFKGDISWEKALEQAIINYLKRSKLLDY